MKYFCRIRWLREVGLIDRVHRQFIPAKPRCEAGSRKFVSVGMTEIRPAVIFLAIAVLMSLLIMLLEIMHVHVKKWRSETTNPKLAKITKKPQKKKHKQKKWLKIIK